MEPDVEAFFSVFQVKKSGSSFNFSARGTNELLGQISPKIKNWRSYCFFMRSSGGWPFETAPLEKVHEQYTVSSTAKDFVQTLVASVSPYIYHVEKMLETDELLAKSGLIQTPCKGDEDWGIFAFLLLLILHLSFFRPRF